MFRPLADKYATTEKIKIANKETKKIAKITIKNIR